MSRTIVHVMGPPVDDAEQPRALKPGERQCSAPDGGENVVFHPDAQMMAAGTWCPGCGETSSGVQS